MRPCMAVTPSFSTCDAQETQFWRVYAWCAVTVSRPTTRHSWSPLHCDPPRLLGAQHVQKNTKKPPVPSRKNVRSVCSTLTNTTSTNDSTTSSWTRNPWPHCPDRHRMRQTTQGTQPRARADTLDLRYLLLCTGMHVNGYVHLQNYHSDMTCSDVRLGLKVSTGR